MSRLLQPVGLRRPASTALTVQMIPAAIGYGHRRSIDKHRLRVRAPSALGAAWAEDAAEPSRAAQLQDTFSCDHRLFLVVSHATAISPTMIAAPRPISMPMTSLSNPNPTYASRNEWRLGLPSEQRSTAEPPCSHHGRTYCRRSSERGRQAAANVRAVGTPTCALCR